MKQQNDEPRFVTVQVTNDQHATLQFIASQMDEAYRRGALEAGEELSLQYLHQLLWRIREALATADASLQAMRGEQWQDVTFGDLSGPQQRVLCRSLPVDNVRLQRRTTPTEATP